MHHSPNSTLVTRDREATVMIANLLTFPLLFISSAFVPLDALPTWVRTVAVINPITYAVDEIRAFILAQDVLTVVEVTSFSGIWNTMIPALAVLLAFNVIFGVLAVHLLDRVSKAEVQ